jgi:glucosamine--fructose-6-phosphate aminotransferase (isomerizing)
VVVLEDNDVLHARQGAWGIFNAKFTDRHAAVPRALETLDMEVAQIMKGGCVACRV